MFSCEIVFSIFTCFGFFIYSLDKRTIDSGIVAEKRQICFSALIYERISLISSIKPMSNILSASSRTTKLILFSIIVP